MKRDIIAAGLLAMPTAVHDLFHATIFARMDFFDGIAWAFTSHDGTGFYLHVAIAASGIAALAFLAWRMLHYAYLAVRVAKRLTA